MNNDLISRGDLRNNRPEFMNEKIVRDTKYQTAKDRTYAKAWNTCNSYWLDIIANAPTVEAYSFEQVQELVKLNRQFAQEIEKTDMRR